LLPFFCSTLACLWGFAQLGWLSAKAFDLPDIDCVPLWAWTEKTRVGYLESFQVIGRCGRLGSDRFLVLCDVFAGHAPAWRCLMATERFNFPRSRLAKLAGVH
jgi:hypothetical protein